MMLSIHFPAVIEAAGSPPVAAARAAEIVMARARSGGSIVRTILDDIVATKREEVRDARQRRPLEEVRAAALSAAAPRDFMSAVVGQAGALRVIAEIKKASPSAGVIREDFDPAAIARSYFAHGAAALSVLTDERYFQGHLRHITLVKDAVALPVLRKDFIVDEYQIFESRAAGADAVLLIAEVLGADAVAAMLPVARSLGLGVIVEVHAEENLRSVLDRVGSPSPAGYILGINNRDLAAQRTDLATTRRLAGLLPAGCPFISESGIATPADVDAVRRTGACGILVGESLLKAADPGKKLQELMTER